MYKHTPADADIDILQKERTRGALINIFGIPTLMFDIYISEKSKGAGSSVLLRRIWLPIKSVEHDDE